MLFGAQSKAYRESGESGNALVSIAIGEQTLIDWEKNALPLWLEYCEKWDIGLYVVTSDLVEKDTTTWKKATWQKLLLPSHFKKAYPKVLRVCYLDTDILISPIAPDIFKEVPVGTIGLVSMFNSLPYDRRDTLDRISYFRNLNSSGTYPLDSSIYMSIASIYEFHGLTPQKDYACMGLFVFDMLNPKIGLFQDYFEKYPSEVESITNGGDQTHLNFHLQSDFDIFWLEYKWQAIWVYEAANKYPYAFWTDEYSTCVQDIASSLSVNYFLHFAGSWPESQLWKQCENLLSDPLFLSIPDLLESKKIQRTGKPVGLIKYPTKKIFHNSQKFND